MTIKEILTKARELITDPANWTQGCLARNAQGQPVFMGETAAVCFCAAGAALQYAPLSGTGARIIESWDALDTAAIALFNMPVSVVNDTIGHEAVLKVYDKALPIVKADMTSLEFLYFILGFLAALLGLILGSKK